MQQTTAMYDAIPKRHAAHITFAEWTRAFEVLDTSKDGRITAEMWQQRRKVHVGYIPFGLTFSYWGVGVGEDYFEALPLTESATDKMKSMVSGDGHDEMAVVGPQGIVALGEFTKTEGGRERWLESLRAEVRAGTRPESMWLEEKGEPRSHPQECFAKPEHIGWTVKTHNDVQEWIKQWVVKNPSYKAMDAFGKECNSQTFAIDFISWLTDKPYRRTTDGQKARTVVYGGLALLAGIGAAYLAGKTLSEKRENGRWSVNVGVEHPKQEDGQNSPPAPSSRRPTI